MVNTVIEDKYLIEYLLKKVKTITSNNGKNFSMQKSLADKIKCIRKYLPKGTDLTQTPKNYVEYTR